jgi:hypothetical protein
MKYFFLAITFILLSTFLSCITAKKTTIPASPEHSERQRNMDVDSHLLKVFETGDVSLLDTIVHPDFVNHTSTEDQRGLDNLKSMVKRVQLQISNMKMEVFRRWADNDYVTDWVRFTGSNQTVVVEGMEVTRYVNGKAIEHWFFPNSQRR